jgi:16S rRNA (cytidine1402-2'-O)-methyltransferase
VLRECSLIATEDTRSTRHLLEHFGIDQPMLSYFEHNKLTRLDRILSALEAGDVALVSEAGTPLLSDPGYELVRTVIERDIPVVPLPGPSALLTALSISGLATDRFLFLGFLPRKAGQRRQALADVAGLRATLVSFEAPHRLRETLTDAREVLGGGRRCAVCRELTKLHEEVWRGTLAGAAVEWAGREPRGEFTLVIEGAPAAGPWDEARVRFALAQLRDAGAGRAEAARRVASQSGWSRSAVYALWPEG